ncbi:MAG: ABC transporter permease [Lachnospiraceae bacterium]|nr:ABC transporter permease [Lachnospiraceae bacterium]
MKSKTSLFNKTIFVSNIKRVWPFWGLLSFAAIIPSVFIAMEKVRGYGIFSIDPMDIKHMYYTFAAYGAPFIAFGSAMIAAMIVWNYLYFPKSVGFFHSIPISKTGLFVTQFASGLAIMLIPYLIGGAIFILTLLLIGGGFSMATFVCIGAVIADSFFFFSFATLIAHLTGHILALPALYLAFNFICIALENIISFVVSNFVYGLVYDMSAKTGFLTPVYKLLSDVDVYTRYTEWNPNSYGGIELVEVRLDHYEWILIYAAVGVVFTIGSLMLYNKRKSEAAGDVISTKCLKPVILTVYVISVTCLLGMLLYYIFAEGVTYSEINVCMAILCFGVALTIGYYTGIMLLEKTVKVFKKKYLTGLAVGAVLTVAMILCVKFDAFRVERRVPKLEQVKSVDVLSINDVTLVAGKDDDLIRKTIDMHKYMFENKDVVISRQKNYTDDNVYYGSLNLIYELKDGSKLSRYYPIVLNKNMDKEFLDKYRDFACDQDLIELILHENDGYEISDLNYDIYWLQEDAHSYSDRFTPEESPDKIKKMCDAIRADLRAGLWTPGFSEEESVAHINIEYKKLDQKTSERAYYSYDYVYVEVKPSMVNTLKAISELKGVPYEQTEKEIKDYIADLKDNMLIDRDYEAGTGNMVEVYDITE